MNGFAVSGTEAAITALTPASSDNVTTRKLMKTYALPAPKFMVSHARSSVDVLFVP